jgi:hypothetical protein
MRSLARQLSLAGIAACFTIAAPQLGKAAPDGTFGMALMSAQINPSGNFSRGNGLISSAKVNTGQYEIIFDRDVTGCTYSVTGSGSPGEALAQPRAGQANGVFVGTYTSAGAAADRGFYLLVFCYQ